VLHGTFSGSGSVYTVWVYWGETDETNNALAWSNSASIGTFTNVGSLNFSNAVTGLTANTRYYFTWRATNLVANIWASPSEVFVTETAPVVDNGTGPDLGFGSATLNGNLVTGNVGYVTIYWGDNDGGIIPNQWDNAVDLGLQPNGPVSTSINGLLFGVAYFYRVFASNGTGSAWANSTTNFKTPDPGGNRIKFRMCGYDRPETLVDFPVLVQLSTNLNGFTYQNFISTSGYDLRFWNSNQTSVLNYEIEEWNTNGVSLIWVQVPSLVDSNTCIFATWGNASASNQPAYTTNGATWSAGYEGVWHLRQPNPVDSSAFGRDGVGNGGVSAVVGQIGSGLNFSGVVADFVGITGYKGVTGNGDRTVSTWVRTTQNNGSFISWGLNSAGQKWNFRVQVGNGTAGAIRNEVNGGYIVHNQNIRDNQWHHAVVSWANDGSPNVLDGRLYVDGQVGQSATLTEALNTASSRDVQFGLDFAGRPFNGDMDEIRIASVGRSANWIWAAWYNMASNDQFVCASATGVGGAGVAILNEAATGITLTSAVLNASFSAIEAVADVRVYWGVTDGGTNHAAWSNWDFVSSYTNQSITNLSYVLNGLTPSSTTFFAWRATNCATDVWAQPSESFSTDLSQPLVNNSTGAVVGTGSAVLNGELIFGNLADVTIYWGDNDGDTNSGAWDNAISLGVLPNGTFSAPVGNLLFGQTYYYRTFAANDVGSNWANITTNFTTLDPGTITVINQSASSITEIAATLNGAINASNAVVDVWVYYGPVDGGTNPAAWSNSTFIGTFSDVAANVGHVLLGLNGNSTYYYSYHLTNVLFDVWAAPTESFTTLSSFSNSLKISFCGYQGGETLTNFPVLIQLSTNIPGFNYANFTSALGNDLRFFNSNQTVVLNYEVETWNTNGVSTFWVQVPALVDTNTCIFAKWGSTDTNLPAYTQNGSTWSEGYDAVWHMSETGLINRADSSGNGYHAVPFNFDGDETLTNAVVSGGTLLDGANDYFAIQNLFYNTAGQIPQISVSAWVYSSSGNQQVIASFDRSDYWRLALQDDSAGGANELGWDTTAAGLNDLGNSTSFRDGQWHYIAGTYLAGANPSKYLYVDGAIHLSANAHAGVGLGTGATRYGFIGVGSEATAFNGAIGPAFYLNGGVDEVRISSQARSSNWMFAAWMNMISNDVFVCYTQPITPPGLVDIAVTKMVSETNLVSGSNLVYTIEVVNLSTNTAGGVVVTDTVPVEVGFFMSIPPADQTNGNSYSFLLPALAPGATSTITISVIVTSSVQTVITNFVNVLATNIEFQLANNTDSAVTIIPDSDNDGVANPVDPDDDNDGFDDLSEAIANTNPTDPGSFLWLGIMRTLAAPVQTIVFATSTGRTYRIQGTTNLFTGPWVDVKTNIPGSGGITNIPETNGTDRLYYRIGVESP